MSKSKGEKEKKEVPQPPKAPFFGVSRFGKASSYGASKFNQKGITRRPTFVTQHKGGGGK